MSGGSQPQSSGSRSARTCGWRPGKGWVLAALAAPMLAACVGPGQEELQEWLTQQRAQSRSALEPVAAPRKFHPQVYEGASLPDPFGVHKLTQVLQRETALSASSSLVAPERKRRRQPLEDIPLDSMTLAGSLIRQEGRVALVRIGQEVHSVPPGAYLGQNYGKVMKVTENQLVLREIVQEASGEWVERVVTLQLQEGKK